MDALTTFNQIDAWDSDTKYIAEAFEAPPIDTYVLMNFILPDLVAGGDEFVIQKLKELLVYAKVKESEQLDNYRGSINLHIRAETEKEREVQSHSYKSALQKRNAIVEAATKTLASWNATYEDCVGWVIGRVERALTLSKHPVGLSVEDEQIILQLKQLNIVVDVDGFLELDRDQLRFMKRHDMDNLIHTLLGAISPERLFEIQSSESSDSLEPSCPGE